MWSWPLCGEVNLWRFVVLIHSVWFSFLVLQVSFIVYLYVNCPFHPSSLHADFIRALLSSSHYVSPFPIVF